MSSSSQRPTARAWRRPVAVGAVLAAAAAMSVGFTLAANASGGGSTTAVHFVSLGTPFKLLTAKSIATNGTLSAVVIGGTTTVPTNATTVELNVTAGGTTAGDLNVYPAGNVSGGSGQFLSWTGGTTDTQTIQENVGLKDEITFALTGATAKVTATITGYSTQVTDGDVSGLDGSNGQVLTNNGNGAAWANPSVGASEITGAGGSAGQVLTNTGSGAQWAGPTGGPSQEALGVFSRFLPTTPYLVASLTVPAGSYEVSFDADLNGYNGSAEAVICTIDSPSGVGVSSDGYSISPYGAATVALQGLDTTTGGTFDVYCNDDFAMDVLIGGYASPTLIATQVSSASGVVANGPKSAVRPAQPPNLSKP